MLNRRARAFRNTVFAGGLMAALTAAAGAASADFAIPAQPLDRALMRFSEQAGLSVLIDSALAQGRTSRAVHGRKEALEALEDLLKGTGLSYELIDDSTLSIRKKQKKAAVPRLERTRYAAADLDLSEFLQDEPPSEPMAQGGAIEEMMVTARRREESLQDVPIAISVYEGEKLQQLGAEDLTFVGLTSPNTTLEVSRGTNTTITAFIRGVGQQDPVAGFEAGVGLYIDDVVLNRPQAAILDIYNVERIEVLRGPQGTLYGRNTIGGAVKYVTKRLGEEPMLNLRVTAGNFGRLDFVGTFETPVTDTLRVGATFARLTRDGFGENLNLPGIENYNKDVIAGRATIEWTPTDQFFFRLSGDYLDDDSEARQGFRLLPSQFSGLDPVTGEPLPVPLGGVPQFPVLDNVFDTRAGLIEPTQEVRAGGFSFLAEYYFNDEITFRNIIGYREDGSETPIDFDSLPLVDLDVPARYRNDQFSEEFQVLYETPRLQALLGFFYMTASAFNEFDAQLGTLGAVAPAFPDGLTAFTAGDVDTDTWAVFTDITYYLTDTLSVNAGVRYTSDERTSLVFGQTFLGVGSPEFGGTGMPLPLPFSPLGVDTNVTLNETFNEFTPRVGVSWEPTDALLVYASYAQGFKGGSFDPRGDATLTPDFDGDGLAGIGLDANADGDFDDPEDVQPDLEDIEQFLGFEPEEIDTFEVGLKSSWFAGRLIFNVAGFYSDYRNVQIPGSVGFDADGDGQADNFAGVTTNAGEARQFGFEIDGSLSLDEIAFQGDNLSFTYALGYLDAEFTEFLVNPIGSSELIDVSDEAVVQNSPEWTANIFATYTHRLDFFDVGGALSWIGGVSYRSLTHQFEFVSPIDQPGFALFDASLVWNSDNGRYQIGVHAKNITDKEYIVAGYDFLTPNLSGSTPLGLEGTLTAFYGNPRTIFGTVQINF